MPHRPPLPKRVILLGWVSFFADVSSEMAYPLLPLFVVGVLGAPATALGGIEGVAAAAVAILTALSGWRSDRIRRRVIFIRWGYGLPVLGKALVATATVWPMVLAGRAIDRIGKGLRSSPRDAMIADAVDSAQRGRAFGYHRAMDTAGAMMGVLAAAALLYWLGSPEPGSEAVPATTFRIVFAIAAILACASLALTFILKEPAPTAAAQTNPLPPSVTPRQEGVPAHSPPHTLSKDRMFTARFWTVLTMLAIFALANSSDAFLLLRAGQVGLSPLAVVLAYALFNLSYALAAYPAGILSDRFGRWPIIAAGWLIYALVYAGFALTGAGGVWPLMALYGCSVALTEGVGKALIVDHAPPDRRATALGILYLTIGFASLASSLVAGLLWDRIGPAALFWFGAGTAAAALILLVALRRVVTGDRPNGRREDG